MKPSPAQLQAALKEWSPTRRMALIFGPDEALVRERSRQLGLLCTPDLRDPFAVIDLEGKALADDPGLLADEAASLPLIGDRKLVRISGLTEGGLPALEGFLENAAAVNPVIATAGDLPKTSKIRKLAEEHPHILAIACYPEEGNNMVAFLTATAREHGLSLDRDAMALLARGVGSGRDIARAELEKLALYKAGSDSVVTSQDIEDIGADAGQAGFDRLINAVFEGRSHLVARQIDLLSAESEPGIAQLRAVARRLWQILEIRERMASGMALESAIAGLRPPVFWKDKEALTAQARRWSLARAQRALSRLLEAERAIKTSGSAGDVLAHQCLLALAAEPER